MAKSTRALPGLARPKPVPSDPLKKGRSASLRAKALARQARMAPDIYGEPSAWVRTHDGCDSGLRFASQFSTMEEVWDNCTKPQWLLWLAEKAACPTKAGSNFIIQVLFPRIPYMLHYVDDTPHVTPVDRTWVLAMMYCDVVIRGAAASEAELCERAREYIRNPFARRPRQTPNPTRKQ